MTHLDALANDIVNRSVVEVRDYVLDHPELFPELEGISEAELTKRLMRERHEIHSVNASHASSLYPVFILPAFLMVGMIVTGVFILLGY